MPEPGATCIECGALLTDIDRDCCGKCEAERVEEEASEALRLELEAMLRKDPDPK